MLSRDAEAAEAGPGLWGISEEGRLVGRWWPEKLCVCPFLALQWGGHNQALWVHGWEG